MTKPVILTGLRANNDLHIGNYLGALLPMVDMARNKAGEYQVNLFVPDLHSFTTPIDHSTLQGAIMNNLRVFVAAGLPLDNADVHIYRQSYVSAHSELTWILDCFTGFGEMRRMTQFKDKSEISNDKRKQLFNKYTAAIDKVIGSLELSKLDEELRSTLDQMIVNSVTHEADLKTVSSVGLFNYPVLMAADIMLYGASYVPVGDDQTQHLEFTRDISERMNSRFEQELFVIPKSVKEQHKFFGKDQGLRVKDLVDPSKKMSKSDETGKGVIFLSDSPEVACKKIMSATTDSIGQINYDYETQPGISSLMDLMALLKGVDVKEVISEYQGQTMYGPFKTEVANVVSKFLADFQTKLASVNDADIFKKLESSEQLMNEQANATLLRVQKAVGLR